MPKAIAEAPKILLVVETETPPKSRFLFAWIQIFEPGSRLDGDQSLKASGVAGGFLKFNLKLQCIIGGSEFILILAPVLLYTG